MIRRPPISTLFPYTTLCRSRRHLAPRPPRPPAAQPGRGGPAAALGRRVHDLRQLEVLGLEPEGDGIPRSEEHTSELQSRQYLVCRLLLEKKNKPNYHSRIVS